MELDIVAKKIEGIQLHLFEGQLHFCEAVAIYIEGGQILVITVNAETDEVLINLQGEYRPKDTLTQVAVFKELTGQRIFSYWKADNHQGYVDVFSLGLEEFQPTLVISVISSSLCVGVCKYFKGFN